ncbi:DNA circularization protein [Pandoraea sp. PE-S2T-3]|uniref:DNA circularization protein n=1 Tax=Pandoraea sp. PE-S2T-3 TaxID=1986993 RepID=UPI0020CFC6A2|nr:DNA circularization N-terminal domain-containing protein [Pandoraea sp. PE-S2T-3]
MSVADVVNVAGSIGGVASAAKGIASSAQSLMSLFGSGDYASKLRKASYNDVPFAVVSESGVFGRNVVVHSYPKKETRPWIEDNGLKTNVLQITGFLVENSLIYGGGDVTTQKINLLNVIRGGSVNNTKPPGIGKLVHPTWGEIKANCTEAEFGTSWVRGRVVELRLTFILGGDRLYPSAQSATKDAVSTAASGLTASSLLSFVSRTLDAIKAGVAVIRTAVGVAVGFYQSVNGLVHSVRRFFNSISTLSGNFGRIFGGSNSGYAGANGKAPATATVASLLAQDTQNVANVVAAGAALSAAAVSAGTNPAAFSGASQLLMTATANTAASPADAIRLLTPLAQYAPPSVSPSSPVAAAQAVMSGATGDLLRRSAIAQLAMSSTAFQPASADDAVGVRDTIVGFIDAEIQVAADQGEDDVYVALRTLRQAVVTDFDGRGQGLAAVTTFQFNGSIPALALANRIYRDIGREDELVRQANPVHPAFMQPNFKALAE